MIAAVVVDFDTPLETAGAVRSLLGSTRPPDAVWVVANGPPGSAATVARLMPRARVLPTPRNLGFAGGANVGARAALEAGADAVFFLNSDATVDAHALDALAEALAGAREAGIAGPIVRSATASGSVESAGLSFSRLTGRMRQVRAAVPAARPPRRVDAVSGAAMLVARPVFERIGFFDEAYFFSFEDLDFCLRAARAGFACLLVPAATARHEGSRSIGRASADRHYFAARNHLRLAGRAAPGAGRWLRGVAIVALNLAHAGLTGEGPRRAAVAGVVRGTRDHLLQRYGAP
jgi:GT2 family glycosyltransferase